MYETIYDNIVWYKGIRYPMVMVQHTKGKIFDGLTKEAILLGFDFVSEIDAQYNPSRKLSKHYIKYRKDYIVKPDYSIVKRKNKKISKPKLVKKKKKELILYHKEYGMIKGVRKDICLKYGIQNSHITGLIKGVLIHTKGFVINKENLSRIKKIDTYYHLI